MIVKKFSFVAMLGALVALGASSASATLLAPNGSTFTQDYTSLPSGTTLIAESVQNIVDNTIGSVNYGSIGGTLDSAVLLDGATGHYDFIYQLTANSLDSSGYENLAVSSFATPVTTDVSYLTTAPAVVGLTNFVNGTVAPFATVRSGGAGVSLTWDFIPNFTAASTYTLVVKTNANTYQTTIDQVNDTDTYQATALVPVPEPSCLAGLVGLVSVGGVGIVWPRKRS